MKTFSFVLETCTPDDGTIQQHYSDNQAATMASNTIIINGDASLDDKLQQCQHAAEDLNVKYLSIVGESFATDNSEVVGEVLKLISMEGRKWNGVKLIGCTGDIDVVVDAVLKTKARKLVLSDAPSDVLSSLGKGLASNSSLLILELNAMTLDANGTESLFNGLSKSSIMELSFEKSSFVGDAHVALGEGLKDTKSIQSLSLKGCRLHDKQCEVVNGSLENHSSILELTLEGNSCMNDGMEALSRVLKTTNLLVLDLGAQQLPESQSMQLTSFADALETSPIRYVQLSDNRIDEANMMELCRGLAKNSSVEILNLSWCSMSKNSVAALSNALSQNTCVRNLNLFGCGIDDQCAQVMAASLYQWNIRKLDLGGRQSYTQEGISELMSRLRENMYLEEVLLNTTSCNTNRFFLDVNRAGRRFLMSKDKAPVGVWPKLLHRAQKVPLPRTSDLWLSSLMSRNDKKEPSKELESEESRRASVVFLLLRDGLVPSI